MDEPKVEKKEHIPGWRFWDASIDIGAMIIGGAGLFNEFRKMFSSKKAEQLTTTSLTTTTPTAEKKAAAFGSGWGDEHQDVALRSQLKPNVRDEWEAWLTWGYLGRDGFVQAKQGQHNLTGLRMFLTTMDIEPEKIGWVSTEKDTKTVTGVKKTATTITLRQVQDVFGKPTTKAVDFINDCVKFIETEKTKRRNKWRADNALIGPPAPAQLDEYCAEYAYVQLVKRFRTAGLPTMPLADETSWEKFLDEQIEALKKLPHEVLYGTHEWLAARQQKRAWMSKVFNKWTLGVIVAVMFGAPIIKIIITSLQ